MKHGTCESSSRTNYKGTPHNSENERKERSKLKKVESALANATRQSAQQTETIVDLTVDDESLGQVIDLTEGDDDITIASEEEPHVTSTSLQTTYCLYILPI